MFSLHFDKIQLLGINVTNLLIALLCAGNHELICSIIALLQEI
jgi:hypothetical protein